MICERCYRPTDHGEHGLYLCPFERRRDGAATIWADDIPGGVDIAHGICHPDGTPKRYYSRSAIKAACEVKGVLGYHEVYAEGGEGRIKDAQVRDDWQRSGEAQRAKRWRDEARAEKRLSAR